MVVQNASVWGRNTLTFPASLAMNPVSDDMPSCFTSYVSNSLPSHTIAAFTAGKLSGMGQRQRRRTRVVMVLVKGVSEDMLVLL